MPIVLSGLGTAGVNGDRVACGRGLGDFAAPADYGLEYQVSEGLARILQLDVSISGEKFTSFRGDGVVIASPTGSTAYSLSAGGAVVHPKIEAILITPICPHALNLRALVIGPDEKITIRIRTENPNEKALLTADGQEKIEIDDSYSVEITRFHMPLSLVKSTKRSYLQTLRENFKFPGFE